MTASRDHGVKVVGTIEWLLIAYVILGIVSAGVCLAFESDARFGAFSAYSLYAVPLSYVVSVSGLGEQIFAEWPAAVFWTAALMVTNGFVTYAAAKLVILLWRRTRKPRRIEIPR